MKKPALFTGPLLAAVLVPAVLMACACSPSQAVSRPSLVFFRAPNCPYCKQMTPIVDEIEREYGKSLNVVYAEVNLQKGKELASRYGIIGYPTILLLDSEGERFGILRGVVPRPNLEQMVDDLLQESQ